MVVQLTNKEQAKHGTAQRTARKDFREMLVASNKTKQLCQLVHNTLPIACGIQQDQTTLSTGASRVTAALTLPIAHCFSCSLCYFPQFYSTFNYTFFKCCVRMPAASVG